MITDATAVRERLLAKTRVTSEPAHVPGIGACWEWTGATTWGYGYMYVGRGRADAHSLRTHRVSYELFKGPIPDGQMVCHRCDNRACVNPDHLFLGDHQINADDMVAKGRSTAGTRHKLVTLTDADVIEIRRAWFAGEARQTELALQFNTSKKNISQIVRGKKWTHLLPPDWTPPPPRRWSSPRGGTGRRLSA